MLVIQRNSNSPSMIPKPRQCYCYLINPIRVRGRVYTKIYYSSTYCRFFNTFKEMLEPSNTDADFWFENDIKQLVKNITFIKELPC